MLMNPTCTYYGVYCQLGFACETMQDYCQLIKFVVGLQHECYIDAGVLGNIIAVS